MSCVFCYSCYYVFPAFLEDLVAPQIVRPLDVDIFEHGDAVFEAKVTGKPGPLVSWYSGSLFLEPSQYCRVEKRGEEHRLTLTNCSPDQTGAITIKASNKAGQSSKAAALRVRGNVLEFNR